MLSYVSNCVCQDVRYFLNVFVLLRHGPSFDMKIAAFVSSSVLHQKLSGVKAEGVIASTKENNKDHHHLS